VQSPQLSKSLASEEDIEVQHAFEEALDELERRKKRRMRRVFRMQSVLLRRLRRGGNRRNVQR